VKPTESTLLSLGFLKGGIIEAIISTCDAGGVPDAAPMGVTLLDSGRLLIRPYRSTVTFANLEAKRCAVVNLTQDPFLFLRTALKELNMDGALSREWFTEAKVVEAPRLRGSEAFLEVTVLQLTVEEPRRANAVCGVELVEAQAAPVRAYCRASSSLIEAAIHATRVKEFTRLGLKDLAHDHRELMNACLRVAERVAPDSPYSKAAAELFSLAQRWALDPSREKDA